MQSPGVERHEADLGTPYHVSLTQMKVLFKKIKKKKV